MTADAQFWNQIADTYSRKPVDNPDAFDRKIAITKARMAPDDVVLDIGCGTGSLALRLAPSGGQLHGLDVSTEMIRIAREKTAAQPVENVTFHLGTLQECDAFEPGSLSGLCAYSLLHLVDDREALLARIFELLKPGGFFVSSTVCLRDGWIPYRPILAVMRAFGKAPRVEIISRKRVLDEVQAAGFVDATVHDVGASATTTFLVATKPA